MEISAFEEGRQNVNGIIVETVRRPVVCDLYKFFPFVTFVIFASNILSFVYIDQNEISFNTSKHFKVTEFWRCLSLMFSHADIFHLLNNETLFLVAAAPLEMFQGSVRTFFIYMLSGLIGITYQFLLDGRTIIYQGASAAVYGIVGSQIANVYLNSQLMPLIVYRILLLASIVICEIVLIFMDSTHKDKIAYISHLFGLMSGVLIGLSIIKQTRLGHEGLLEGVRLTTSLFVLVSLVILMTMFV